MPRTRTEKSALIDELEDKLEASPIIYLTDFSGLSVREANELRGHFFKSGVDYHVCKNTLLRIAMDRAGGYEELEEFVSGPIAVAFSDEPAAPARAIKDFQEDTDLEMPQLRAAYVDGSLYDADQLDALAKLKSRDELIGDILALLQSPVKNVVAGLQAPGRNLAGAIQSIAEKEEA